MAHRTSSPPSQSDPPAPGCANFELIDLVDAIVAAVDIDRSDEVTQLRQALDPFGAVYLSDAELRLNGTASNEHWCCFGECSP
jgi:hypothetical protein